MRHLLRTCLPRVPSDETQRGQRTPTFVVVSVGRGGEVVAVRAEVWPVLGAGHGGQGEAVPVVELEVVGGGVAGGVAAVGRAGAAAGLLAAVGGVALVAGRTRVRGLRSLHHRGRLQRAWK